MALLQIIIFHYQFQLLVIKSKFTSKKNQRRQKGGTAEFKVALVLSYTCLFQVLFLINLSILRSRRKSTEVAFQEYFHCESGPQQECDPPVVDASSEFRILRGFVAVLQALIPVVILLISVNVILKTVITKCSKFHQSMQLFSSRLSIHTQDKHSESVQN